MRGLALALLVLAAPALAAETSPPLIINIRPPERDTTLPLRLDRHDPWIKDEFEANRLRLGPLHATLGGGNKAHVARYRLDDEVLGASVSGSFDFVSGRIVVTWPPKDDDRP